MTDAYLQVSVFVGFTLIYFYWIRLITTFDTGIFLSKTKKFHVPISAFLRWLCLVVEELLLLLLSIFKVELDLVHWLQFLTATMGDAAFLILALRTIDWSFNFWSWDISWNY